MESFAAGLNQRHWNLTLVTVHGWAATRFLIIDRDSTASPSLRLCLASHAFGSPKGKNLSALTEKARFVRQMNALLAQISY